MATQSKPKELIPSLPTIFLYLAMLSTLWGYGWLIELRPQYWTSLSATAGAIVLTIMVIAALLFTLGTWQLLTWLHKRYLQFSNNAFVYAAQWGALWVIFELLRSFLFSTFVWGKGSNLGFHWTFGDLGYLLVLTPLQYLVRLLGLYGSSWVIVSFGVLVWTLFKTKGYQLAVASAACIVVVAGLGSWLLRPPSCQGCKSISVYVVPLQDSKTPNKLPDQGRARLILLPEYAFTDRTDNLKAELGITNKDTLIYSDKPLNPTRDDLVVERGNTVQERVSKQFLIPGGEYLSWLMRGGFTLAKPKLLKEFDATRQIHVTKQTLHPVVVNIDGQYIKVGVLICSSIVSPSEYRKLTDQGANILVNTASIGILKESKIYPLHNKLMARFIAISNQRPLIQVAKNGQSFLIGTNGHLQAITMTRKIDVILVDRF